MDKAVSPSNPKVTSTSVVALDRPAFRRRSVSLLAAIQLILERDEEAVDLTQPTGVQKRLGTADPSERVELYARVRPIHPDEPELRLEERVAAKDLSERIPETRSSQRVADEVLHLLERHRDDLARDMPRNDRFAPGSPQPPALLRLELAHTGKRTPVFS